MDPIDMTPVRESLERLDRDALRRSAASAGRTAAASLRQLEPRTAPPGSAFAELRAAGEQLRRAGAAWQRQVEATERAFALIGARLREAAKIGKASGE